MASVQRLLIIGALIGVSSVGCDKSPADSQQEAVEAQQEANRQINEAQREAAEKTAEVNKDVINSAAEARQEYQEAKQEGSEKIAEANQAVLFAVGGDQRLNKTDGAAAGADEGKTLLAHEGR